MSPANFEGLSPSSPCLICLTGDGQSFGWRIIREHDSAEIARSEKTFTTRLEALADSARVAASMSLAADALPPGNAIKEED